MTALKQGAQAAIDVTVVAGTLVLAALAGSLLFVDVAIAAVPAVAAVAITVVLVRAAARRRRQIDERSVFPARLLDSIPRAIFVVEAWQSGRPNTYVNDEYCALTGYAADEAVADDFDALAVFAEPGVVAALADQLPTGISRHVGIRRRDGTTVVARLDVRPLREGTGFVVLLDPSQAPLRSDDRGTGSLAHAVLDTTPATVGATDAFLSWLTHELRSPLNACVMWLDVLALAPQPDKLTKAVEAIKRNLARQTKLVSDLNDAAKVSGKGLEVRLAPLDLVALLTQCIDAWQLAAIGKQLSLQHRIEISSADVEGDAERLVQALNHVVDNAINSMAAGGRLELRVRRVDDACLVEVEDTGGTLSTDDAAHLFEPLWRSGDSAKMRSGVGLGLAVAHHIVTKHGGTLTASSGAAGAIFTLSLPLIGTETPETMGPAAAPAAVQGRAP